IKAAWARSGDKGASANVGVIARHPDLLPYLWEQLTEEAVAERFAHILEGRVQRFAMPGLSAINFLLTESLGGGGIASLRADAQGKGFSQVILTMPVRVPERLITP
ncbi:MAG: terpene utilization protein AtuA, partial [Pseudomonadota bacterium]